MTDIYIYCVEGFDTFNMMMEVETLSDRNIKDGIRTEEDAFVCAHAPLGMAYVPFQRWEGIFDAETALCKGTLFKAFDLPYLTKGGCGRE
ncbi:MAG: spore coat associated protein CotJA [Anaerolineaceae bacterium]|jgi:hypothetical protein